MALGTFDLNKLRVITGPDDEEDSLSILKTDLTTLTVGQRVILGMIVATLGICSVLGNVGTLYVHRRRKLRVFFRTCLISLAISDLITSLFTSVAYLAQFGAPSVQIWCVGGVLCRLIPVLTTAAILVSSMTLLGIAFDRYYSVMRASNGFWKPNTRCSIVLTVLIWLLSLIISTHLFFAYAIYHVHVLVEAEDSTELIQVYLAAMCVSSKEMNAYYYLIVLAIIFVPTVVAFVWLNSIIANKLWIRRHSLKGPPATLSMSPSQLRASPTTATTAGSSEPKEKQMEMIPQQYQCHSHHLHHLRSQQQHCRGDNKICTLPTPTVPTSFGPSTAGTKSSGSNPQSTAVAIVPGKGNKTAQQKQKHISSREARHLRMFTIILILMAVFIFFRLPAWIFLIMRLYGSYTHRLDWILHFSFGILTLTSCVLNPLLYTFLPETIRYTMLVRGKLCGLRRYFENHCGLCRCRCCPTMGGWCRTFNDNQNMTQNLQHQNANQNDKDGDNDNANVNTSNNDTDNDCTSNDGAKSTSKKSDDDSDVYTIIPVPERLGGWRVRQGCSGP